MGKAISMVRDAASTAAAVGGAVPGAVVGAVEGALVGVVSGGVLGARVGVAEANFLPSLVRWGRGIAGNGDPKSDAVKEHIVYIGDDDTVISASLSSFMYTLDGRLLETKETTACWRSEEKMKGNQEVFNYMEPGHDKRLILAVGTAEVDGTKKKFVAIEFGNFPLFCWLGNNIIVGGLKIDVHTEVGNHFRRKNMKDTKKRVVRAMFGSGGALSPPYCSVILREAGGDGDGGDSQSKCILFIAWQGTMPGQRPIDIFTDLGAAPVKAGLWNDTYPDLWVHSAMYAKVQHDALGQKESILQLIQAYNVGRIVFCGHSLGGGLARIAHVATLGMFDKLLNEEAAMVKDVDVKSITWAAPMVLFQAEPPERKLYGPKAIPMSFDDLRWKMEGDARRESRGFDKNEVIPIWDKMEKTTGTDEQECRLIGLRQVLMKTSVNHIFDKDVVPQLPGNQRFFKPALKMAARSLVEKHAPALTESLKELADSLVPEFFDETGTADNLAELEKFAHMCPVVVWSVSDNQLKYQIAMSTAELPDWKIDTEDSYHYLLTCHSVLPHQVQAPPHDVTGYAS